MVIGFIAFCLVCGSWWASRPTNRTAVLSDPGDHPGPRWCLNSQKEREIDGHRRDVAMHAKLDELLLAMSGSPTRSPGSRNSK
jgi:hypothetical protein